MSAFICTLNPSETHIEAAREFIRPHVERGDSYENLRKSFAGSFGGGTRIQIGGYFGPLQQLKKLTPDQIGVEIDGNEEVLSLQEVFTSILLGE